MQVPVSYTHLFLKLLNLAVEGITSFSIATLRIATVCGVLCSISSFISVSYTHLDVYKRQDYNPSIIANYAYDLVKEYNQFYQDFSMLREEKEALKVFRLALSANVGKIVKTAMGLRGIEVPERM